MEYKDFEKVIGLMVNHSSKLNKLYSEFKIDLIDSFDEHNTLVEMLWDEVLTEEGSEWLGWFLYDKNGISGKPRKDINGYDGSKKICRNLKELHGYLVDNKYFKNQK
jgi:hypothetical protein